MRLIKLILCIISVFLLPTMSVAQSREITEDQFYRSLRAGFEAAAKVFPRREKLVEETFENGRLVETREVITEYFGEENINTVTTETYKGKRSTSEMIQIGALYYCREGKGKWKKEKRNCGGMSLSSLPNAETTKFLFEDLKDGGKESYFFSQYRTHKWENPKTKITKEYFFEDKFWVFENQTLSRRVLKDGEVATKQANSTRTYSYDYKIPSRVLKAPIK